MKDCVNQIFELFKWHWWRKLSFPCVMLWELNQRQISAIRCAVDLFYAWHIYSWSIFCHHSIHPRSNKFDKTESDYSSKYLKSLWINLIFLYLFNLIDYLWINLLIANITFLGTPGNCFRPYRFHDIFPKMFSETASLLLGFLIRYLCNNHWLQELGSSHCLKKIYLCSSPTYQASISDLSKRNPFFCIYHQREVQYNHLNLGYLLCLRCKKKRQKVNPVNLSTLFIAEV